MVPGEAFGLDLFVGWCRSAATGQNGAMDEERWWYNTKTGQVEPDDNHGPNRDVLGPYKSQEEASRALEIARERTEKWDREDKEWEAR